MTEDPSTRDYYNGHIELNFNEPSEVLVELAKRGEIDPWDIDIARTTEKFLEYLDTMKRRDLRIPARTLLYASILLRMKSDSMEDSKNEDLEPELDEFEPVEKDEIDALPQPPVRRHNKRPVTLEELIEELRNAELVGCRKVLREKWPLIVEKALDLSHDEGIEDLIKKLRPILNELFQNNEIVSFGDIISRNEDCVTDYVSLLFMAHRKQIWLEQAEIYGDLFIKRQS